MLNRVRPSDKWSVYPPCVCLQAGVKCGSHLCESPDRSEVWVRCWPLCVGLSDRVEVWVPWVGSSDWSGVLVSGSYIAGWDYGFRNQSMKHPFNQTTYSTSNVQKIIKMAENPNQLIRKSIDQTCIHSSRQPIYLHIHPHNQLHNQNHLSRNWS